MTAALSDRRLVGPSYVTAQSSVVWPFPHDVDLAPQLLSVTLAQAALAANHRAIDSAHPILALADRRPLTDSENLALRIIVEGNHLAALLADYIAAVVQDNHTDNDYPF